MRRIEKTAFMLLACTGVLTALLFSDNIPEDLPASDRRLLRIISVVKRLVGLASRLHSLVTFTHPTKSQRLIREQLIGPWLSKPSHTIDQQVLDLNGVPARAFKHKSVQGNVRMPGLIYLHGGGWAHGSSQFYQPVFNELISRFDNKLKVIAIDYRLVPDFVYPVQLDDCLKAVKVLLDSPEKFQLDQENLLIAGDSAGGNLALALSLRLRDENYTSPVNAKLKSQILMYPSSHAINFLTRSFGEWDHIPILSKSDAIKFILDYMDEDYTVQTEAKVAHNRHVSDELRLTKPWKYAASFNDPEADHTVTPSKKLIARMTSKLTDPYLFPLMADDLSRGLPRTYILTCEYDVLRDDGLALSKRMLDEAPHANAVVHKNVGCFHGGLNMFARSISGKEVLDVFTDWIRKEV